MNQTLQLHELFVTSYYSPEVMLGGKRWCCNCCNYGRNDCSIVQDAFNRQGHFQFCDIVWHGDWSQIDAGLGIMLDFKDGLTHCPQEYASTNMDSLTSLVQSVKKFWMLLHISQWKLVTMFKESANLADANFATGINGWGSYARWTIAHIVSGLYSRYLEAEYWL